MTAEGHEGLKNLVKELDNMSFEYGDFIKVYHVLPSLLTWYHDNELVEQAEDEEKEERIFKITPQGFKLIDGIQDVKVKPQQLVIETDVEKLDAKSFVEITNGEVVGFIEKPDTSKLGIQQVKVETKDAFGNKKITEVPLEIIYGDSLVFHADDNEIRSIVTLQHDKKELHATFTNSPVHYRYVNEEYMGITLYDQNGKEKQTAITEGQVNSQEFGQKLAGTRFEYGDIVKVFHAEPDRLKWYQKNKLAGQGQSKGSKNLLFKVTENGFESIEAVLEVTVKPQQVVVGTEVDKLDAKNFVEIKNGEVVGFVVKPNTSEIGKQNVKIETKDYFGNRKVTDVPLEIIYGDSIMFFGTHDPDKSNVKSVVTLNHDEKKLNVTSTLGETHYVFRNKKYMGVTLYDKNGNEKNEASVRGDENTKVFATKLNGIPFEYSDVMKVYQREDDRFKVYKKNVLQNPGPLYTGRDVFFKITEQGFEKTAGIQKKK